MWQAKILITSLAIVFLALITVFFVGPVLFASVAYPLPEQYRSSIANATNEYCQGVDDSPNLLAALIYSESTWRPNATSHVGAVGLTQFMPATARGVAKNILGDSNFDPNRLKTDTDLAIKFGAYYLCRRIADYGGNVGLALIAYNGGGGAVNAFRAGNPVRGTVGYRDKILAVQKAYRSIYGHDWYKSYLTSANGAPVSNEEFAVQPKADLTERTYDVGAFWQGLLTNPETVNNESDQQGGIGNFFRNLFQIN